MFDFRLKSIDNLNPVNFKGTYMFDRSCIETKNPKDLHKMFGFAYGLNNYVQICWTYSKEMDRIYTRAKICTEHNNEKCIWLMPGCDFNEAHDYKIEIERWVTSYKAENGKTYSYADRVTILVDDKIITKQEFYTNREYVLVFGKGLHFYDKKQ